MLPLVHLFSPHLPAGEKIPMYFELVKKERFEEAWHVILDDNPLPGVCGRVCYHPCEGVCNRKEYDSPIAINNMERFVADQNMDKSYPKHFHAEKTGLKIAIIGSGPAGLSAAYQLARKGHSAIIYESLSKPEVLDKIWSNSLIIWSEFNI